MNFNVEVKDLVRAGMWKVIDEEIGRLRDDNARLKAEVERLTKLCQATSPDGFIHIRDIKQHPLMGPALEQRQREAKEGKPSV